MYQLEVVQRKRQLTVENNLFKANGVNCYFNDETLIIKISNSFDSPERLILPENIYDNAKNINVICEEGSKSKLLLQNYNEQANFIINIKKNAELVLNFLSIKEVAKGNYHLVLEENAQSIVAMADLAKGKIDLNILFDLLGDSASAEWHLASLGANKDCKIFNINFNHIGKNTRGIMSNYGVVEDKSFMHFKGDSHIKNGSVGSQTHQSAKIMVFDEKCHAKANPILKIDENDIEASHAAVVGKVNEEHMYYLCSRGISELDAKQLITCGYLKPIVSYFSDKNDADSILNGIEKRL